MMKDKVEKFKVQNVKFSEAVAFKMKDLEKTFE